MCGATAEIIYPCKPEKSKRGASAVRIADFATESDHGK
jgi:hypothetical protein